MPEIGIINEIGDMGLGFDPLTESQQEKLKKESSENNKENKDEK